MKQYVLSTDPAVDRDPSKGYDREKFVETGDLKYLPVKPGTRLTVYTIERPTIEIYDFAMSQPTETRRAIEFVAYCLKSIEENGVVKTLPTERVRGIGERVLQDELRKFWIASVFAELAVRAVYLANLPPLS